MRTYIEKLGKVSIHAPVWVRPVCWACSIPGSLFQFTHPCGCDRKACVFPPGGPCFNSRTRVGATIIKHKYYYTHMFQFTHPCGCDSFPPGKLPPSLSFNSRTRVGATYFFSIAPKMETVSIHAPVWVRPSYSAGSGNTEEFQFTHPCGCDCAAPRRFPAPARFNSRTRVGATSEQFAENLKPGVSIHAPVWVRLTIRYRPRRKCQFQFTHPCGCDAAITSYAVPLKGFNSRTRVGATSVGRISDVFRDVSIHAPVWVRPCKS